jgi:dipeptidyl aminopeptidase/acylaminoacyl peptidase
MRINTQAITVTPPPEHMDIPTSDSKGIPLASRLHNTAQAGDTPPAGKRRKRVPLGWILLSIFILAGVTIGAAFKYNLLNRSLVDAFIMTSAPRPTLVQSGLSPSAVPTLLQSTQAPPLTTQAAAVQTAAATLPAPTLEGTNAVPEDQREDIVFASNRSGLPQLWVMAADGSQQRQLTNIAEGACQPDWSPDGMKIVFISPCIKKEVVYPGAAMHIIDMSTHGVTDLPFSPEGDYDPAWSPDGGSIAYTSLHSGKAQIYLIFLKDNSVKQLTNTDFESRQPAWSPDGQRMVFSRIKNTPQIWIMVTSDGLTTPYAVDENVNDTVPDWSPNGEVIYFNQASYNSIAARMVGIRYDPTNKAIEFQIPTTLDKNLGPVNGVSVSPDDRLLLFESWPDGKNHDIYTMTISGTNITRLTTDTKLDFDPDWRPTLQNP